MRKNTLINKVFNKDLSFRNKVYFVFNGMLVKLFCNRLNVVHVVEFPKCGGSWVRNMIRVYLGKELFLNDRFISNDDVVLTHKQFTGIYKKPVVVFRDPRDMYVSFYHYETSYQNKSHKPAIYKYFTHDEKLDVRENFANYLRAKLLKQSHPWFYYSQFVNGWVSRPNICKIRYEDCLEDAEKELIKIIRYIDKDVDLDKIASTVEETSFASITKKKYGVSRGAGEADNTKFHRKGVAGDWKNYFNEETCYLIDRLEGETLKVLGYENDNSWIESFISKLNS